MVAKSLGRGKEGISIAIQRSNSIKGHVTVLCLDFDGGYTNVIYHKIA